MPGSRSTPWCRKPVPAPIPSASGGGDLGIPVEDVTAVQRDTDGGPTDAGAGSGSSVGGTHAALGAAQGVRQQLTFLAAECYGWPEERIVFRRGRVFVEETRTRVCPSRRAPERSPPPVPPSPSP